MGFLSQDHLCQLLARGRAVEQWLGPAHDDGEPTLKWVCVQREPSPVLTYSVALMEVYDEGEPLLTAPSLLDVDEPEGKIMSFETREEALDHVVKELGGSLDRFVRDGEIQQEYEKYLSEHSAPPVVLVQSDFLRGRQTLELLNDRVIRISTVVGSDRMVAQAHLASLHPEPQRIRKWNIPSLVLATPMVLLMPIVIAIGIGFVVSDPSWSNALFAFLVDAVVIVFAGLLVGNAYTKRQNSIIFASTIGEAPLVLWFNNPDEITFDEFLSKLQVALNRVDRTSPSLVETKVEQPAVCLEIPVPQVVLTSQYVAPLRSWWNWRRPLRTQVMFEYPARFVGTEADDAGVLSIKGAGWLVSMLKSVPDIEVNPDLCQEDWGVVIFVNRNRRNFHVGLNFMDEGKWLVHVDNGGIFVWIPRFNTSRKQELLCLVMDLHNVLSLYPSIENIAWYTEKEAFKGFVGKGFPTPD